MGSSTGVFRQRVCGEDLMFAYWEWEIRRFYHGCLVGCFCDCTRSSTTFSCPFFDFLEFVNAWCPHSFTLQYFKIIVLSDGIHLLRNFSSRKQDSGSEGFHCTIVRATRCFHPVFVKNLLYGNILSIFTYLNGILNKIPNFLHIKLNLFNFMFFMGYQKHSFQCQSSRSAKQKWLSYEIGGDFASF